MPEMGDGDDDQQVESHSEKRHGRQKDIKEYALGAMLYRLPAGDIE